MRPMKYLHLGHPLVPRKPTEWLCVPCYQELLVIRATEYDRLTHDPRLEPGRPLFADQFRRQGFFLPGGHSEDLLLDEPPLALVLGEDEADDLRLDNRRPATFALAATDFGPRDQEKKSNEDYALSVVIEDSAERSWAFAAVADGVSTRTFWAARSSRLACLAAYQTVRQFILDGRSPGEDELKTLRQTLVERLRELLAADRNLLMNRDGLSPVGWDSGLYRQHIERKEYWYNTTLLVSCLGPTAGFLIWAGDGGIKLVKHAKPSASPFESVNKEVLRSTADLTIDTFVSLDVTADCFKTARISYGDQLSKVEVFLASDGVDRTLQMNPRRNYESLSLFDPRKATRQLRALCTLPQHEPDNYSVARVTIDLERSRQEPPQWSAPPRPPPRFPTPHASATPAPATPPDSPPAVSTARRDHAERSRASQMIWDLASYLMGLLNGGLVWKLGPHKAPLALSSESTLAAGRDLRDARTVKEAEARTDSPVRTGTEDETTKS